MKTLYDAECADDFYKIIKANYRQYDMIIKNSSYDIENIKKHLLQEMPSTQFLDYSFATKYIHMCKYYYRIYCNDTVFHIVSKVRPNIAKIKQAINKVMITKYLYTMQKPLEFYVIMNPAKRYFAKKTCMQAKHINGGFTNPYSNKIYIVRKQEYDKVMLHELLHHIPSYNKHEWSRHNILKLKNHFQIDNNCKFYPNEAVIETLAYMIYICMISIEKNKQFAQVLRREQQHSCALANQIIRMQNKNKWYEQTNTYCYIVLKYIFFCNFDKYLPIIRDETLLTNLLISYKIPYMRQEVKTLHLVYHS